jgi:hypothetical protein
MSVLESAGVTSLLDYMQYFSADFFSLYKTRGFSLHILAPFRIELINSVLYSMYTFSTYRNKLTNLFLLPCLHVYCITTNRRQHYFFLVQVLHFFWHLDMEEE